MTSSSLELRRLAWQALESGGLLLESSQRQGYVTQRLEIGRPFAEKITERVLECAYPVEATEISLLHAIPMMVAFACTVTDCLYKIMTSSDKHRDEIRLSYSLFIVWSALFDHICDDDPSLLPLLSERVSENALEAAITCPEVRVLRSPEDPHLVQYVTSLLEEQAQTWRLLRLLAENNGAAKSWEDLVAAILELRRAELLSRSVLFSEDGSIVRQIDLLWPEALWIASLSVACTPDVRKHIVGTEVRHEILTIGFLLSLIDDVVDIETDWRTKSRNQLVQRVWSNSMRRIESASPPWDLISSDEILLPYMHEITSLAEGLSDSPYRLDVAGWLYAWLAS